MVNTAPMLNFLNRCLRMSENERINVIFDAYKDASIKSVDMMQRRSDDGVVLAYIVPCHRIKLWRCLLACVSSKTKLVQFVVENWKRPHLRESRKARYYM